jgi:hypothetical protein
MGLTIRSNGNTIDEDDDIITEMILIIIVNCIINIMIVTNSFHNKLII